MTAKEKIAQLKAKLLEMAAIGKVSVREDTTATPAEAETLMKLALLGLSMVTVLHDYEHGVPDKDTEITLTEVE